MARQIDLKLENTSLRLHADKSISMPDGSLLLADLHLGKVMHFRREGLAIPSSIARQGIKALNDCIERHRPKQLILLGDLFHSSPNSEWLDFEQWLNDCPVPVTLVRGNHDRFLQRPISNMRVVDEMIVEGVRLLHMPDAQEGPSICGHLHPACQIKGLGKQRITLPCFYMENKQLIMPAFGAFTGKHRIRPTKGSRCFICTGNTLEELAY